MISLECEKNDTCHLSHFSKIAFLCLLRCSIFTYNSDACKEATQIANMSLLTVSHGSRHLQSTMILRQAYSTYVLC